jgi:hypothetical protein
MIGVIAKAPSRPLLESDVGLRKRCWQKDYDLSKRKLGSNQHRDGVQRDLWRKQFFRAHSKSCNGRRRDGRYYATLTEAGSVIVSISELMVDSLI